MLENGTTPARRAMSCSPSCQCMASAARQGMPSSVARGVHISGLNLLSGGRISLKIHCGLSQGRKWVWLLEICYSTVAFPQASGVQVFIFRHHYLHQTGRNSHKPPKRSLAHRYSNDIQHIEIIRLTFHTASPAYSSSPHPTRSVARGNSGSAVGS